MKKGGGVSELLLENDLGWGKEQTNRNTKTHRHTYIHTYTHTHTALSSASASLLCVDVCED